ncbi:MAG: galactokinase [Nanoarchaeota archaeon]
MIITRSPMRITLGGGGTDLPSFYSDHVGFVLSMAVDKYFYSVISPRDDDRIQVISSDFKTIETRNKENIDKLALEIPKVVMKHFDIQRGCNIFTSSEVPSGTGLGSSGSVMVNLIKALSVFNNIEMSKKEVAELACYLEMDVMGAPVGKQDQYIAAYGGIQNFIFQKDGVVEVSELRIPDRTLKELENNILIFYTGIRRDSASILTEQKKGSPKTTEHLMYIKDLGIRSRDALNSGDLTTFAELMREHWEHKKKLVGGVTNERIDMLYNLGLANGALSGKLLGAGGGGFLLLYADRNHDKIREEMEKEGLSELDVKIDKEGVKTIINTMR